MPKTQRWRAALSAALFLILVGAAQDDGRTYERVDREQLVVGAADLTFVSCHRMSGGGVCRVGQGLFTGCAGECYIGSVDVEDLLELQCGARVLGRVVEGEMRYPLAGLPITLWTPDRRHHDAITDKDGHFEIRIEAPKLPDRPRTCLWERDFGELAGVDDGQGVYLVAQFTEAFRRAHPEVEIIKVPVPVREREGR